MTLQAWTHSGWLRVHDTQPAQIQHLWDVAEGDLRCATDSGHSVAVRFEYAYNAALKFCIIALYAERRRPGQVEDVHHTIIRTLPLTLGPGREVSADYLDACRERRDRLPRADAPELEAGDVEALHAFAYELRADVRAWLERRHPELIVAA